MTVSVDAPAIAVGGLVCAGLAVAAVLLGARTRDSRLARLGTPGLLARILPWRGEESARGRALRLGLIVALTGLALAGPRWGEPMDREEQEGIDIVIAIDASLSMLAEDEAPSRLARARQEVQRLIAASRGDRIGLIAFAGRSYILTPLTADAGALALFLDNLDPSIVGEPGSSLAAVLRQGRELLESAARGDRALILLTDAESFDEESEVLAAASRIRQAGISLVLVGMGTEAGATIPIQEDGRPATKLDADGVEVVTRHDAALMGRIAAAANGVAIESGAADKAGRIRAALAGLQTTAQAAATRQRVPLRYQWVLALALGVLLVDRLLLLRRAGVAAPVLAGLLVVSVLPRGAWAQSAAELRRAEAEFRAQRPLVAARAWRQALERGDRSPRTLYNLGTAYLAADSLDSAIEILERVVTGPPSPSTDAAWYNLGLAYLRRGLAAQSDDATASLRSAVRANRRVLLAAPGDSAARWNYELAAREVERRGGAGARPDNASPADGAAGRGRPMPQEQAAQLLDAASREERETRARQQAGRPVTPARGRDW
jgi:Ca-activated chloride channel family protein